MIDIYFLYNFYIIIYYGDNTIDMIEQRFSRIEIDNNEIKINISNKHSYKHYKKKFILKPSDQNLLNDLLYKARRLELFRKNLNDKNEQINSKELSDELQLKTEFTTDYNYLLLDLFGDIDNISFADYDIYIQYNKELDDYEILLILDNYNAQIIANYIYPKIKTFPGYIRANQ